MKQVTFSLLLAAFIITSCSQTANQNQESDSTSSDETENQIEEKVERPAGYAIGDVATDFSLENVDGNMVSLADYPDAKGFIITFTCNHCPYAVAYESRIMALNDKYAPLGYPVIAISPNDPKIVPEDGLEEMKKLAAEKGYSFPYLLDADQSIYPQYGATKTPHIYLLNKEDAGNVVKYIGTIDNNYEDESAVTKRYVEDAVDALLAGNEIALTTTKAIGCSIKDKRFK
jgi:peroxiredoxin